MKIKSGYLLDLEEIYLPALKHLDRVRREVGQPQVRIYETSEQLARGELWRRRA